MTDIISETDFVDGWGAKAAEDGNLFTYEQIKNQNCRKVWSIVEGNEDDHWYALAGFHVVNMLGYVLTDQPWETGLEQAMWCESLEEPPHEEGSDGYPDDYADGVNGYLED